MIYLDNMATTKPLNFPKHEFLFNPNAAYAIEVHKMLDVCRDQIKKNLGLKGGKIIFCSSASHAVEILKQGLDFNCNEHEHASVYDRSMCKWGTKVRAFACQYANPIDGNIFNIEKIAKEEKEYYPYFISDFTAAIGRTAIPDNLESFCDAIWFSAHKFHGPLGVGCLWISDALAKDMRLNITSTDEYGLVYGTPNIYGIMDMTQALEEANSEAKITALENNFVHCNDILVDPNYTAELGDPLNYSLFNCAAWTVQNTTRWVRSINLMRHPKVNNGAALANYLASKNIYVGLAHSACEDSNDYRVAKALGVDKDVARASIRVSYSKDTKDSDVIELRKAVNQFIKDYC